MRAGSLHRLEREWAGETALLVRFPMRPKVTTRYNEAVAVERGPLVYALAIGEEWTRIHADKPHRELPHGDFEVRPTTPWNYGLVLDPARPEASLRFEERPVGERPFSPEGAGMSATAKARRLPRLEARARLGGRGLARRPGVGARGPAGAGRPPRGGPPDSLRLHEHPDHGVPEVEAEPVATPVQPRKESAMRQARVALGILALTGLAAALAAGDWPGFRGLREGVSDERGLPERWSATEGIAWRAAVPGAGWSSPIVSGDRVFVTTATEEGVSCRMLAFDRRTGALLWTTEAFKQKPTLKERQNSYATPTPVTDGERVYAVFGEGGAAAFSFDGRVLWTNTEHPFYSQHGLGASPILVDALVLQPRDGSSDGEDKTLGWQKPWDRSFLLALDARTGRTVYRAKRGLSRIAHVTPAVVTVAGRQQVVSPAGDVVQGFEPASGRLLWTARSEGEGVVPSVVRAGDLVVTASGFGDPALRAYRLGGSGDVTATHLAWEQKKAVPMISSPAVAAGLVFVVNEKGIASALDAATGAVVWQERLPGTYSASPLAADGRVYFLSEDCETTAVAAGREFRRLGGGTLPGRCQASIAVASGRLFVRTDTELYAIGR